MNHMRCGYSSLKCVWIATLAAWLFSVINVALNISRYIAIDTVAHAILTRPINNTNTTSSPFTTTMTTKRDRDGAGEMTAATSNKNEDDDIDDNIQPHAKLGVDPIYIELFQKAQVRSRKDYASSHIHGKFGIVIGPTEGRFTHTLKALRNGKRIRSILGPGSEHRNETLKIALMASPEHVQILDSCSNISQQLNQIHSTNFKSEHLKEACRLWNNGTLFDHVIAMQDPPYKHNDNHTELAQGSSKFWLKALGGYRLAPYRHSFFLDSDSYPCPGIQKLFQLTDPYNKNFGKYWQLPSSVPGDLAIGIDQYPMFFQNKKWIPGDEEILSDSIHFAERNTGAVLFNFERPLAHTLAHFIPLVSEHIYNNVATPDKKVLNDQVPFRVALYLFQRFQPQFVEHQIPMHASCRTYPGLGYAGTDGFLNGMYPLQQDGRPCRECSCTPCLINHNAGSHKVTMDGYMGWEEDAPAIFNGH